MSSIAVLGLGAMGSGLAGNLVATGHTVTVWNRTRSQAAELSAAYGVAVGDSPAAAVATADVALACVTDDQASAAVWLDPHGGALAALPPQAIVVEASTLSPEWIRSLGRAAQHRDIRLVEAPIIGSRPQLAARGLVHLGGGDQTAFEEVREVLETSASRVQHVGPLGTAATIKLVINGLFAVQAAVGAEVLSVLTRSFVDLGTAVDILTSLPATSPALARLLGVMRTGDFAPNFPIRLVAKDLSYLDRLARHVAAETPMLTTALTRFRAAQAANMGELDIAGIAELS